MISQSASEIKEKIFIILKKNGPSLPVHIAKEINLSMLFTSAFLADMLSEKRIRMSDMRVGSSPIYFLPDQESMLENFSHEINRRLEFEK